MHYAEQPMSSSWDLGTRLLKVVALIDHRYGSLEPMSYVGIMQRLTGCAVCESTRRMCTDRAIIVSEERLTAYCSGEPLDRVDFQPLICGLRCKSMNYAVVGCGGNCGFDGTKGKTRRRRYTRPLAESASR